MKFLFGNLYFYFKLYLFENVLFSKLKRVLVKTAAQNTTKKSKESCASGAFFVQMFTSYSFLNGYFLCSRQFKYHFPLKPTGILQWSSEKHSNATYCAPDKSEEKLHAVIGFRLEITSETPRVQPQHWEVAGSV